MSCCMRLYRHGKKSAIYAYFIIFLYIYKYISNQLHIDRSDLCPANSWGFGESHGYMHFHKLELQLSNAPGFRLGNLLPFADFCLTIFMCSTVLDDDVVEKWNRALATVLCTFCRPHLPKVLRPPQFFKFMSSPTWWWCGWHMNSGSRYSLGHLLPTSSSKSAPNVTVFYDFYMKSSSRYSDVHLLSTTLPDRAPQLRKLRPFGDHGSHLIYPKKCRASRPRMFSSLNSCVPDLSHSSTNTYMMMWWPWWLKWWNRALATVSCAFFQSHLPEVLPQEQFFTILIWNRALATVSCTFSRPHLPKAFWTQQFFKIFKLKSSSRSVVCTFCRPHLAEVIRAPQFFTINLFKSFQSCIHAFPTCYTSQLRHDELAWWCGWHHGDITMMRLTYDTGLSLQSRAPFPDLIFQKCSDRDHFFTTFIWNRALATVLCTFSRSHLPKVLRARQFFSHIQWKPRSRYTLVHILPTSSSRSAPSPTVFFTIFMWNRALTTVLCAFCRPHLPKALRTRQFFTMFMRNRDRNSPVHFSLTTFPDQAAQPRKQRPFSDHGSRWTKYQASRPRMFSSLNSRVPHLSHFRTAYMMMWLTYEIGLWLQSRAPFSDLMFQKCSERDSFFYDFYVKSSSRYRLVHLFLALISQKCSKSEPINWKSSSRYSRVHILSTSSGSARQFFTIFYAKSSSRYSPVRILSCSGPDSLLRSLC